MRERRTLEIEFRVDPLQKEEFNGHLEACRRMAGPKVQRDAVFEAEPDANSVLWISEWRDLESLLAFVADYVARQSRDVVTCAAIESCRLVDASPGDTYGRFAFTARLTQGRELAICLLAKTSESS